MVSNLGIFDFSEKFGIRQIWGRCFQIWQYSLKFYQKSIQIRHIWSQIYALLLLFKVLRFSKSEGADYKYGNNYFQSLPQKYPNKAFFVRNLGIFVFSEKFGTRQIWGSFSQIRQYSLKFLPKRYPDKTYWSEIDALLFLFKVLEFDKSKGVDFKYENSYLKFCHKNIKTTYFCMFSVLYFCKTLQFAKSEGADLKNGNNYFQSVHQKYPNKAFLVPNKGIFVFSEKFGIRQTWGSCFQICQYSLKILPKKIPK